MNLHLLKIFVQAVQSNSFTKAADVLGITQPAVSKSVKELESQLEIRLLDRVGKQFSLTEAGRVLFEYGQGLLAIERDAEEAISALNSLEKGHLSIGASTTIASYWLAPYVACFGKMFPGVKVSLSGANTASVTESLLACEVDVALVEGEVSDPRIESRNWREEEMVAIGAPRLVAQSWEDEIQNWVWVLREAGSGSRSTALALLEQMGVRKPETLEVNSNEAIVQLVANGLGLGIVPRICARDQIALGRVQRLNLPIGSMSRKLYRLRLPHRPVSPAALAFEGLLGLNSREIQRKINEIQVA